MCTVSWFFTAGGYELFSNRDESRVRRPASPPRVQQRDGVRFLAPEDGEAGGSWIAVNELGLGLCLLNLYEAPAAPAGGAANGAYRSRGLLVSELAGASGVAEATAALSGYDLSRFRPFTLLALAPGGGERAWQWTGERQLDLAAGWGAEPPLPLSSSGFDAPGAARARAALLADLRRRAGGLSAELLLDFHRSHQPERGPYSPCMHRSDAKSVSLSWVRVAARKVEFRYAAGSPCKTDLGEPLGLERVALPAPSTPAPDEAAARRPAASSAGG